jgi:hypothetical protein
MLPGGAAVAFGVGSVLLLAFIVSLSVRLFQAERACIDQPVRRERMRPAMLMAANLLGGVGVLGDVGSYIWGA